jgi:hypothetical protein
MEKAIKAKVLLVRIPPELIGLLTSLIDGSGRKALVRTKESKKDEVYLIATPDTYQDLLSIISYIKRHIPQLEVIGTLKDGSETLDL